MRIINYDLVKNLKILKKFPKISLIMIVVIVYYDN